jgi:hypothetical protein
MTGAQDTTGRSMMKMCLNCQTENLADAVFCSQCGMSLTRARTGEEAVKAREEMQRARPAIPAAPRTPGQGMRRMARILALIWAGSWTVWLVSWLLLPNGHANQLGFWISAALLAMPPWIIAGIPWRSEVIGGFVLLVQGLINFITVTGFLAWLAYGGPACVMPLHAAMPVVAGILFLASHRKTRTSSKVPAMAERTAGWMRSSSRALAVIWASSGTFVVVAATILWVGFLTDLDYAVRGEPLESWFKMAVLVLIPWLGTAVAWRWDRMGGVVLVLQGFVGYIGTAILVILAVAQGSEASISKYAGALIVAIPIALPPWVLGSLFLAGWWKSRTSQVRQGSEGGR